MADIATLGIAIDSRQVNTASSALEKFRASGAKAEGASQSLVRASGALRASFAGLASAIGARELLAAADAYANINARLRLVTRSALEYAQAQQEVFAISQRTSTGLEATATLFGSLSRATQQLGISQTRTLAVTEAIGQAIQISGTSASSAAAALVQLGQGLSAGTLRGEELNSILEQAPRLAQAIADGLNVPIGALRKLGEQGKLTSEQVFGALEKSTQALANEAGQLPITFGRATQQAGNSLLKLIGTISETTGATSALGSAVSDAAGFISDLADEIRRASQGFDDVGALASGFQVASETVQVLYANVKFVFQGVGREIGAVAAQLQALATLNFSGFSAISDAVKDDAKRARAELDSLERRILVRNSVSATSPQNAFSGAVTRPDVERKAAPGIVSADKGALRAAKAQVDAELAEYQRGLTSALAAYGNYESLLDARRDAGLLGERAYYAAKLGLINDTAAANILALQQENDALARSAKTKADQIENSSKIADNEAEIARLRQSAATQTEVLSIKQQAADEAMIRSFADLTTAAQAYLNVVEQQYARELDTLSLSRSARGRNEGIQQIEDKFSGDRQRADENRIKLEQEGNFTEQARVLYERQLQTIDEFQQKSIASFEGYYNTLEARQLDWSVGAQDAIQKYIDNANDVAANTEAAFTKAFNGMTDALVEFAFTGKLNFADLAKSIISDLIRIAIQAQITQALTALIGGFTGGGAAAVVAHGGGVIGQDSFGSRSVPSGLFAGAPRFHGGMLAKDEYPAILQRGESVMTPAQMRAMGGATGGGSLEITVINETKQPVQGQQRKRSDGGIDLILTAIDEAMADRISNGYGNTPKAMESRYGLRPSFSN
jgi:lambda family phage tail tape measure protein